VARPIGVLSVPVGAILVVAALLTGVFLVLYEQGVGSVPAELVRGPVSLVALAAGTWGVYLLLSAWSRLASGPGAAHPPGRRLRLALLLLALAASGVLVALPSAGALLVDLGPGSSPGNSIAAVRTVVGAAVGLASGTAGAYLLRDVRRRRARQRQRLQHRQQQRHQQRRKPRLPEQRQDVQPARRRSVG